MIHLSYHSCLGWLSNGFIFTFQNSIWIYWLPLLFTPNNADIEFCQRECRPLTWL